MVTLIVHLSLMLCLLTSTRQQNCSIAAQNNQTALEIFYCNGQYVLPMTLGTPPQSFWLTITVTTDISWIKSVAIDRLGFNESASSTVMQQSTKITASFQEGQITGYYMSDQLAITDTNISISDCLVLVSQLTDIQMDSNITGILSLSTQSKHNIFQVAATEDQIAADTIVISLNYPNSSYIYYNHIPQDIIASTVMVKFYNYQLYTLRLIAFFIDAQSVNAPETAIIDLTQKYSFFNSKIYSKINSQYFQNCQAGLCPCSYIDHLPTFSFMLEGALLYLAPQQYMELIFNDQCEILIKQLKIGASLRLGSSFVSNYNFTIEPSTSSVGFQGTLKPVSNVIQQFFMVSQYLMVGLMVILLGFGVYILWDVRVAKKVKHQKMRQISLALTTQFLEIDY